MEKIANILTISLLILTEILNQEGDVRLKMYFYYKIKLKTYESRNNLDNKRAENYYMNDKVENSSKISATNRNYAVAGGGCSTSTHSSTSGTKKATDSYASPLCK